TDSTKQSAMAFAAGSNFVLERPLSAISVGRTLKAAYGLIIRERLRYFRCPISIPAAIRDQEAGEIRCQAVNISEGGMAVISSVPLKPGMQVTLQFAIPGQGSQFAAESEICWCDEKGRAGLRFGALSPEQKTDLKQWLSKMLEETLPESVAVKQLGVSGAASVLGVGRTTIHRKLRSYQAGSPEPEPGWRAVPVTKVNALLAAAAKAAEFLRWCQGTMAPRLGERLDATIQDLQGVAPSRRHPKHYKTTRGTS